MVRAGSVSIGGDSRVRATPTTMACLPKISTIDCSQFMIAGTKVCMDRANELQVKIKK